MHFLELMVIDGSTYFIEPNSLGFFK